MGNNRKDGRKNAPGNRPPSTARATPGPTRGAGSTPSTGSRAGGRQSVAAARSAATNRTQPVVLIVACVVIAAVIIFGLVVYNRNTAVQGDGYGESTASTAAVSGGMITVSGPATPGTTPIVLDLYEDGLCPVCSQFEEQFGQQMAQALDTGRIVVNYHLLTFLDPRSPSGDYSTRAGAAALCVAQEAGSIPGAFEKFHTALFAEGTQPEEGGTSDLSNAQLAQLAADSGAGAAGDCITSGAQIGAAQVANTSGQDKLKAATGGRVGTPSVIRDGKPVSTDVNWLTTLLATP